MSSTFHSHLHLSIFGQSHSEAIGFTLDRLPAGVPIDLQAIQSALDRRAPGQNALATARRENDRITVLCGLKDNKTCGSPLTMIIQNHDTRPQDYKNTTNIPRPSHADYPAFVKYGTYADQSGGGHFSGRLTAPLVAAGAVAQAFLDTKHITIGAHLLRIGGIEDDNFVHSPPTTSTLAALKERAFPVLNEEKGALMQERILQAKKEGDSVGGIVEACAQNVPAGLGEPFFDGMESTIASLLFSIPGVRGVEFGTGFASADLRGSCHNDAYVVGKNGQIKTKTNHHGGILGGITTGMPILVRCAFKPTASIKKVQESVDLTTHQPTTLQIKGRHDPVIAVRALPVVESVLAIALLDALLAGPAKL